MTRTLIVRIFPVSIVGLLIGYAATCNAQIPISGDDEKAIKEVIAATTEAFNKHDAKAFATFYASDAELVTVRGERMKGAVLVPLHKCS